MESGSNDPMAYMLTVMFIGIIRSGSDPNIGMLILNIVIQLVVGAGMGYLLGKGAVLIINHIRMANASLYPVLLLVFGNIYICIDLLPERKRLPGCLYCRSDYRKRQVRS